MKKLISCLLCLTMLVSLGNFSVYAEGLADTNEVVIPQEEQGNEAEIPEENEEEDGNVPSQHEEKDEKSDLPETEKTEETLLPSAEVPTVPNPATAANAGENGKRLYLSDIPVYKLKHCQVGWGTYTRDKDLDGRSISLWVGGKVTDFTKGVCAHAAACLIYDLGEDHAYDVFEAYIGVDSNRGGNGNVKFVFMGSKDYATWTELYRPNTEFRGNTAAEKVSISVKDYRYFRVDIDENGVNSADHSVLADARFETTGYTESSDEISIPVLMDGDKPKDEAYFKEKLNGVTAENLFTQENAEQLLLQYTLIKACGYQKLKDFLSSGDYQARISAFTWLFTDADALREFMNGGNPDGSNYIGALEVLTDLYAAYREDLSDTTPLRKGETAGMLRGGLYRRMMLCLSLVCANGHKGWMARAEYSNPVNRYAYFKRNYEYERMRDEIFENLCVDEMRWVLGNNISDAEIIWLNDYARLHPKGGNQTSYPMLYSPHHHIAYQWYDYDKEMFYSEENRALYTNRYSLSGYEQYGLVYGYTSYGQKAAQRLWQVFADGAVCGNISRTGANLAASFGVPACEVGQPGHAAFCIMNKGANNQMTWGIDNDISGWSQSSNSRRMPADWGNVWDSTVTGYSACYVLLSQSALNDYANYEKAEETLMLLALTDDRDAREAICRKALSYMPFHRDAWLNLIQITIADQSTTAKELGDLAQELADSPVKFYPNAFRDLMQLITNRLKAMSKAGGDAAADSNSELGRALTIYTNALIRATKVNSSDTLQPGVSITLANALLSGNTDVLATFSFDGNNAFKIVFRQGFTSIRFQLCLDGSNWVEHTLSGSDQENITYTLTDAERTSLSTENDIYIWLVGWASSQPNNAPEKEKAFWIDIKAGVTQANTKKCLESNDFEDAFIFNDGEIDRQEITSGFEYSTDNGTTWAPLTKETKLSGSKTVLVHTCAYGTTMQGEQVTFTFTDNHNDQKRSYIPLKRITLYGFSSDEASKSNQAENAIDGRESTLWHTRWSGGDNDRFITLKLDEPTFLSGIDYLPRNDGGTNGIITTCEVYVSVDGESWYKAANANWAKNSTTKSITFEDVAYGQYIRIVGKAGAGNFAAAREIRVFEDKTFAGKTVAGVRLVQDPYKLSYLAGEPIDFSGADVECVYTDGTMHKVPASMLTVSPEFAEGDGTKTVNLKYLNLPEMTFNIYVTPNTLQASSITIATLPAKLNYILGAAPEGSGMMLYASCTDGETKETHTWLVQEGEYTLSPATFTEKGEQQVTVSYQGQTAQYTVNVIGKPVSLSVTKAPEKTSYLIGEELIAEDMEVTVAYEDESTEVLTYASGRLRINGERFSALPGEKTLTVKLTDAPEISVPLAVTVQETLNEGDLIYSVEPCNTEPAVYRCYLSGYTNGTETVVSVPATVTRSGVTYQVIGVRTGTFDSAPQVKVLSLPGSIQILEESSLSALTNLNELFLTGIADIGNLTIQNGALPESSNGTIIMASENMESSLIEKMKDYQGSNEQASSMKTGDLISDGHLQDITLSLPKKTTYELDENYDNEGFAVTGTLSNGIVLPLEGNLYTMTEVSTATYGEKTVTVSINGTEISKSFTVKILSTAPVIAQSPKDEVYLAGDTATAISAISVIVKDGEKMRLAYQWYRSENGSLDPGKDSALAGATAPSYTPDGSGWYYVTVWRLDAEDKKSNPVYSMAAHIQVEDFAIVVDSGAGGKLLGYNTLYEAMNKAPSGSTLLVRKNLTVDRMATAVSKTLTLKANADNIVISRAQGYTGCVIEATNCTLTVDHLTLDGGAVWTGDKDPKLNRGTVNSGIAESASLIRMLNNTHLTVKGGTVVQNCAVRASGGAWGAAIYLTTGSCLNISDASFLNNAQDPGYTTGCGGAIQTDSETSVITVENGTFAGNFAPANGGALCINQGRLVFKSGTIEHCAATKLGGGIYNQFGTIEITGGSISNCTANSGGAIYNDSGSVVITGGSISNCTANSGGGIYNNSGSVTVSGCSMNGNKATYRGGAVYTNTGSVVITDSEIRNGSGATDGGAIFADKGNVTLNNTTISEYTCSASGGAVCMGTGTLNLNNGTVIENCTGKNGGAIWSTGGIINVNQGSTIRNCTATMKGGAIYSGSNTVNLNGGVINGCSAQQEGGGVYTVSGWVEIMGGSVLNCKSNSNGGAVYTDSGRVEMYGGLIDGNTGNETTNNAAKGGGIYSNSGLVNIIGGTVQNCTSSNNGGGIYANSGSVSFNGGTVQNCTSSTNGGGIYAGSGTVSLGGGTIRNCVATTNGGGICIETGNVTMNDGLIEGCKALNSGGGGIASVSTNQGKGNVVINGGTIKGCVASYAGGGVYISSHGSVTINGGTFLANEASGYGGVVATNSGVAGITAINGGTFKGNQAKYGGAIFIGGASQCNVTGGTFMDNTATDGGAVYCSWNGGTHNISGGLFLQEGSWYNGYSHGQGSPNISLNGGTFTARPTVPAGCELVETTHEGTTLYTLVRKEESETLKAATILHETGAKESIDKIKAALETNAGTIEAELTDDNLYVTLRIIPVATRMNEAGAVTKQVYEVSPMVAFNPGSGDVTVQIPDEALCEEVAFALPVDRGTAAKQAMVYHKEEWLGIYPVETNEDGSKCIRLSSKTFSEFSFVLLPEKSDEALAFTSANLAMSDNITVNFKVLIPEGYTDSYMVFDIYNDDIHANVTTVVKESKDGTVVVNQEKKNCKVFAFTGVNPQRMNDSITATLFACKDGVWYKTVLKDYSVKKYCTQLLKMPECSAFFPLINSLIAYGTAAQEYKNYETNSLISTAFVGQENYKPLDYRKEAFDKIQQLTRKDGGISIQSVYLIMNNEVSVCVKFKLDEGTSLEQVKFVAGIENRASRPITDFKDEGKGVYSVKFSNVAAADFNKRISFTSYVNETEDDVLGYNVNYYLSYFFEQDSTIGRLCKALFDYGYAAQAYVSGK